MLMIVVPKRLRAECVIGGVGQNFSIAATADTTLVRSRFHAQRPLLLSNQLDLGDRERADGAFRLPSVTPCFF